LTGTAPKIPTPSRTRGTPARARPSAGGLPPRPSTSTYDQFKRAVLRRPVERKGSAAIAVMHEAGRGATPRDGAVQRLERDGLLGARGGSPPHNPPREGIEEDREEEPALAGPDLSDVREPEVVGGLGGE